MVSTAWYRGTRFAPVALLAIAVLWAAVGTSAWAQPGPDANKSARPAQAKNPAAPKAGMESPELPKEPATEGKSTQNTGKPVPPEQPYPSNIEQPASREPGTTPAR